MTDDLKVVTTRGCRGFFQHFSLSQSSPLVVGIQQGKLYINIQTGKEVFHLLYIPNGKLRCYNSI